MDKIKDAVEIARVRQMARTGRAKEIRTRAGLTIVDLAEALDVSTTTIFRWERALCSPRADAALRYGRLLTDLGKLAAEDVSA